MAQKYVNSFGTRKVLKVGTEGYEIFGLAELEKAGFKNIARLPVSLKVLLENLLRQEDNHHVNKADIEALAKWEPKAKQEKEIAFMPARVLMQDLTGVPAVVDLAAMREAMKRLGGDPKKINPLAPVDLVIDHSVQVDYFGTADAFTKTPKSSSSATSSATRSCAGARLPFDNFRAYSAGHRHLPSGQSRISRAGGFSRPKRRRDFAYPDTVVGTDSHTTMINGLGVVGWGVGGIEAEAALLGQPIIMLIPEVIGFKLARQVARRRDRHGPGANRRADAAQKRRGRKIRRVLRRRAFELEPRRPRDHRQHGAGVRRDDRLFSQWMTRRCAIWISPGAIRTRSNSSKLMRKSRACSAPISRPIRCLPIRLELDLGSVVPSLAGPRRPQDRVPLTESKQAHSKRRYRL